MLTYVQGSNLPDGDAASTVAVSEMPRVRQDVASEMLCETRSWSLGCRERDAVSEMLLARCRDRDEITAKI